jgi:hypothetical protein
MYGYANLLRKLFDPMRFPALRTLLAAGVFVRPRAVDDLVLDRVEAGVGIRVREPSGWRRGQAQPSVGISEPAGRPAA